MSNPYTHLISRKGATRSTDITKEVLEGLNCGALSSINLTEWLCVDNRQLAILVLNELGYNNLVTPLVAALDQIKKATVNTIQLTIGTLLVEESGTPLEQMHLFKQLSRHSSDTVRCWAAYMVGVDENQTLAEKFLSIRSLAADHHFGVREVAWLAIRPSLAKELNQALSILVHWASDTNANIRRFASESTRPRGVWCAHIASLKTNPEQALPILESLKNDPSEYVRNSVANWLNDASKTQPEWVKAICKRWERESPTRETSFIIKRALRSV